MEKLLQREVRTATFIPLQWEKKLGVWPGSTC
ncbi:hypothetical protein GGD56_000251 [Rhizobium mongolense]|uniref:Uncharacterized protein n=1 Tax=Rhizobium mongolense TaxID=57676 RepID=A0ABR6IEY9_9HYPH|nr:hypothetical protein [Rhizobium mongolense]